MAGVPIAAPTHNGQYCAFVDDWDNASAYLNGNPPSFPPNNIDSLKTPSFSTVGQSTVFLSLDYMFWNDDGGEVGTIACSINNGAWTTLITLTDNGGAWADSALYDVSAQLGGSGYANVRLAFIYNNGYGSQNFNQQYVAVGMCVDNIRVFAPVSYDLSVTSQNSTPLMQAGTAYTFSGSIYNSGATAITSMTMNYSVNGGAPVSQVISGISGFNTFTSYNWSMNTSQFTPATPNATYKVKFWANNLNTSFTDGNHANDTLVATFTAFDSLVTKQSILEEFTGQSCVFCMLANPNVDSVIADNATTSNIIKYHVPIPGRDFMYNETTTPVSSRQGYYSVNSAPSAFLDGISIQPSAYFSTPVSQRYSSTTVQGENAVGSPFTLSITSSKSIWGNPYDSFSVSFTVKSHGVFSAGQVTAQAVLTVDNIAYNDDLSQDDPQVGFAPPDGSTPGGDNDYYYSFVLNFPNVVEAMLPSASGTSLPALTNGQTQSYTLGWKKKHPWGEFPKGGGTYNSWGSPTALLDSTEYDSSATAHFVVFLQTNNAITSYNIPAKYIFQSATSNTIPTGMQEIESSGAYFKMYPNPTNANTNVAFVLEKDQNVSIQVYNLLGENVSTINEGQMSAGRYVVPVNTSALPSGIYMIRFIADNSSTTSKLVIQK